MARPWYDTPLVQMGEGVHVISGRGLFQLTKESKGWRRWFQNFFKKNLRSALRWEPKNGFLCKEGTTQHIQKKEKTTKLGQTLIIS
jgi:hypothetical protein